MWVVVSAGLRALSNKVQGMLVDSERFVLTGGTILNGRTLSSGSLTPETAFEWKIANRNSIPYFRKM